ncbi:hypothetical protein Tco_1537365 [Tanacetum coccineum]
MGRTRYVVHEEKERKEKEVSTKDEGTDKQKVSTDKEKDSFGRPDEGTVDQTEGRSATPTTPTPTTFRDDETIAQVLLNMSQAKAVSRENEKGVELKDVENIERPRPTSTRSLLTLKPLPKIDLKDRGKKKIEEDESDTESEGIPEAEKKFKQLARDEEMARKDERKIKEMNDGAKDVKQKGLKKKVVKETPKKEDTTKMLPRKRKRPQPDVDSDDEHRKCLKMVTFEGTIDSEIMERKSIITRLNKVSSPDEEYLVIYKANGNFRAFNYLLEIVTWRLYEACEVYILELEDGTIIHMLVERRCPLSKDLMQRMLILDQKLR